MSKNEFFQIFFDFIKHPLTKMNSHLLFLLVILSLTSAFGETLKGLLIETLKNLLNNSFDGLEEEITEIHLHIYLDKQQLGFSNQYSCSYHSSSGSCICNLNKNYTNLCCHATHVYQNWPDTGEYDIYVEDGNGNPCPDIPMLMGFLTDGIQEFEGIGGTKFLVKISGGVITEVQSFCSNGSLCGDMTQFDAIPPTAIPTATPTPSIATTPITTTPTTLPTTLPTLATILPTLATTPTYNSSISSTTSPSSSGNGVSNWEIATIVICSVLLVLIIIFFGELCFALKKKQLPPPLPIIPTSHVVVVPA